MPDAPTAAPELSVVVPCFGRVPALVTLLETLHAQELSRARHEVILVDDGNTPPLVERVPPALLDGVRVVRQANGGPAAAKNAGVRVARGRIVLFLNADARLGPGNLAQHLASHSEGAPRAVLGRFDATADSRSTVVELCERLGLVFPYHLMTPHAPSAGRFFWTSNLSVPTAVVRRAGGFDARFRYPIWEDVELGYRLERQGVPVVFDPRIDCGHDHPMDLAAFVRRAWLMGHEWVRFTTKHGPAAIPVYGVPRAADRELAHELLAGLLMAARPIAKTIAELDAAARELDAQLPDLAAFTRAFEARQAWLAECIEALHVNEPARGTMDAIFGFGPEDTARVRTGRESSAILTIDTLPEHADVDIVVHAPAGTVAPTDAEVEALLLYLATSPAVGAVALGPPRGEGGAEIASELPPGPVAVRRACLAPTGATTLAGQVRAHGRVPVVAWLAWLGQGAGLR